jgi:hypothetical protein
MKQKVASAFNVDPELVASRDPCCKKQQPVLLNSERFLNLREET